MRSRRLIPFAILLGAVLALVLFFLLRARQPAAAFGPAVAYCPGPDLFGYTCASADAVAYIDATNDTRLYADDGLQTIDLPFPFDFYGVEQTEVTIVTNGFLVFGGDPLPLFSNTCLDEGPLPELGEALLPFWDDLDVSFVGFIETELVGETPNQIFVIEWDGVPRYGGDPDDTVTFQVQFSEATNSVTFLYQDVTFAENPNGASATVGQQSARAGVTLQYACEQPTVAEPSGVQILYPEEPNEDLGAAAPPAAFPSPALKTDVAIVADRLVRDGRQGLLDLRTRWLNGTPQRDADFLWADVAGDEQEELIYLWRGPQAYPERHAVAVLTPDENGTFQPLLQQTLGDRGAPLLAPEIVGAAELTGDDATEVVLRDGETGRLFILTTHGGSLEFATPGRCRGAIDLKTGPEPAIRCGDPDRQVFRWWQNRFINR